MRGVHGLAAAALMAHAWTALAAQGAPLSMPSAKRGGEIPGLEWELQPVRAPVRTADIRGVAPRVPGSAREVAGPVEVGADKGAAFWLSALDVVEVSGPPGALRFLRVPRQRAEGSTLRVEERGIAARPGVWYLAEPVGEGSVWVVTAARTARITVRRPVRSSAPLDAERTRDALLAWIDGQGDRPPLPFDAALRTRLEVDAEIGSALVENEPELAEAVRAWRKASALRDFGLRAQQGAPHQGARNLGLPGEKVHFDGFASPYQLTTDSRSWEAKLEGPGILSVELRALLGDPSQPAVLELVRDGRPVGTIEAPRLAARIGSRRALWDDREARTLGSGEAVGESEELRVALSPGEHVYRLRWSGRSLVRARVFERRPFAKDALAGVIDWDGWAERAWRKASDAKGPAADLLRQLVHQIAPHLGEAPMVRLEDSADPSLEAVAALAAGGDLWRDGAALLSHGALRAKPALEWEVRLGAARAFLEKADASAARELLRAAPAFPPSGWHASEAALLLARLPDGDPLRSRAAAALELAWRAEPLSDEIRHRYRVLWARETRWVSVWPTAGDDRPRPVGWRWLDRETLDPEDRAGTGALWPLEPGRTARVTAPGAGDASRVLRAYVALPEGARGQIALRVDGERFPLLATAGVEAAEIALPGGEHAIHLEAPEGATAWLSLPPLGVSEPPREVAWVRTHWPLRAGTRAVRFRVPDAQLPTPVRVHLRAAQANPRPLGLWLRTDVGPAFRIELAPGGATDRHLSVDAMPGRAGAAASAIVHLPPFTREVWFDPDDPEAALFATLAIRRGASPLRAPAAQAARPAEGEDDPARIARLSSLSRQLSAGKAEPALLLARADLLLDAAEEGLAREDVVAVLGRQDSLAPEDSERLARILDRLESDAPDVVRFKEPLRAPVLLSPGYAALAGDPEATERYARARALAAKGESGDAALELVRLYRDRGAPSLAVEALALLERVQTQRGAWADWGAPISVALGSEVLNWAELPLAERVRRQAARWTKWQRLRDAEQEVGTLNLAIGEGTHLPAEQIRKALLASSWPLHEARLVSPGRSAVLELRAGPSRLGAQVRCGSLRASRAAAGKACRFSLRVDGREAGAASLRVGEEATLSAPIASAGRHQLEVVLDDTDAPVLGLSRFVALGAGAAKPAALEAELPHPVMRARPGEPVTITALGPTVVRIQARALRPSPGREVRLASTPPGGRQKIWMLALPVDVDRAVRGAPSEVGRKAEAMWLLPERGAHTLTFDAVGGEALVRVSLGATDRPPERDGEWWTQAPTGVEPLPWPSLPARLTLLPGEGRTLAPPRAWGTLSPEVAARGDDLDDGEIDGSIHTALEARLGYRQQVAEDRLWVLIEPSARLPIGSAPVFGGRVAAHLRELPLDLRLTARAGVFTQTLAGVSRSSVSGRATVDRWVRLGRDVGLVPGASIGWNQHIGAGDPERFDRSVYWRYREAHPQRWSPRLTLRWRPLQDHVGEVAGWATSNADLTSLDHANARASWSALLSRGPDARLELRYEASWRPEDAHRPAAYLRHGLSGRADLGIWSGRTGRLLLYVEDTAYLSSPFGFQNVLGAGVRWDWTGGRGLRDLLPFEEEFEDLL